MIETLLVLLLIGLIVQVIPMDGTLKRVCYIVLGVVVLIVVLRLLGIEIGSYPYYRNN